jgi:hypothetical protein
VVGLTFVDPAADVDVKVPGVMVTLDAPVVAQFRVLLAPVPILAGLAANDVIAGAEPLLVFVEDPLDEPPQFTSPVHAIKMTRIVHKSVP